MVALHVEENYCKTGKGVQPIKDNVYDQFGSN